MFEMKNAVEHSGGVTVQADSYANPVFKDSLRRMFTPEGEAGHLGLGTNATFEVHCSRDIKVCGLLGPASAVERKSAQVADTAVGVGGTTLWKLATLGRGTTLGVVFDIVAAHGGGAPDLAQQFFLQFLTRYLHASGTMRCRVTTVTRR